MTADSARPKLPPPLPSDAHKGQAGRLLCFCGSPPYPGAAVLVARAAQRAGAGLVTLTCLDPALMRHSAAVVPEAVHFDLTQTSDLSAGNLPREIRSRKDHARLLGPGLGDTSRTRVLVREVVRDLSFRGGVLLDADALNVLEGKLDTLLGCSGALVLTPHGGEAARLLGVENISTDPEGRVECAREIARLSGAICCLKGKGTVITDGERYVVNPTGNAGLATAGAGDVLAGIMGAYLCRIAEDVYDAFDAAIAAVYVHGRAGDLAAERVGERALIASDIVDALPAAQRELDAEN